MPRLPVALASLGLVAVPMVAIAAWTTPPVDLSAPGQSAVDTFGSVDAAGNTVAYWMRPDGVTRRAQAARRVGGTWRSPQDLSPAGVDVIGMASPAGGAPGISFAGWQSEAGGVRTSSVVRLSGAVWSAPQALGSGPVHPLTGLRIAANSTGAAVATWTDQVNGNYVVDLARYGNGAWAAGAPITDPAQVNSSPRAVVDDAGVVTVAWWSGDIWHGQTATLTVMRSTGTGWGTPVAITTGDAVGAPAMAVDPQGMVTIAWRQVTGGAGSSAASIQAARFAGGAWSTPVTLDPPDTAGVTSPRAATDGAGNVFVTWSRGDAPTVVAKAAVFTGGAWSVSTVSGAGEEAWNPHIAAGGTGATVMWASGAEGRGAIRARRWADGAWGATSDLSPAGRQVNRDSWDTQASNGSAMAIWLAPKDGNDIAQAVTFVVVPDAPATPTVRAARGAVEVTWVPATDPGGMVTFRATATPGGRNCIATSPANTCTITGLVNGRSYRVQVTATNTAGTSPSSPASAAVMPVGVPGRPRSVRARTTGTQSTVTWQAPVSNGGRAITGYVVQATPGGARCITGVRRSCTIGGLPAGRAYRFTVRARNAIGLGPRSLSAPPLVGVTG